MLALSDRAGVVLLVVGGLIFIVAVGFALFQRARSREVGPDIPDAMKPGPADAALETPLLQKLQGWAVVLTAFFAVWIPLTWLVEPSENYKQDKALRAVAIARGKEAVEPFSETNQLGVGCTRCHGPELQGGLLIPNGVDENGNPKYATSANLTTICGGPYTGHPLIKSLDDIYNTVNQGRPGTPMPSWSIRYAGALDDQQINDIVSYIISINHDNVPFNENICENPDAAKAALAGSPAPTPSGTSPAPSGASPTPSGASPAPSTSAAGSASPSAGAAS